MTKRKIMYKPRISTYFGILLGAIFLFSGHSVVMGIGVFFIAVSLFVLFGIKNRLVAEISAEDIVIYNHDGAKTIRFEDMYEWNTFDGGIYIKTNDRKEYFVDTYCTASASDALKRYAGDKETIMITKKNMDSSKKRSWFKKEDK